MDYNIFYRNLMADALCTIKKKPPRQIETLNKLPKKFFKFSGERIMF